MEFTGMALHNARHSHSMTVLPLSEHQDTHQQVETCWRELFCHVAASHYVELLVRVLAAVTLLLFLTGH